MATTKAVIDISINTSDAAAQIRQLQTQINAFNATLNKNSAAHAQASRLFADALVQSVNVSQAFTAEQVRMETAARRLDQTLVKGRGSLGQYFSARFRKDSADAAAVLSLANDRAAALQTQFIKLSGSAGGFRDAIAIRPLQALNDSMDVANQKAAIHSAMFRQATTSMINFGKNTQWAGRQLMVGFTVPLTIFGAAAGKTFQEIEQAAVRFKKVYGDAFTTPAEIEENMKAVQGLALEFTKYGIAVKDTIGLAAEAAAAGAQNADLIAATTEATRLATLGQMEQQEALTATIALQNAFKLSSQDLGKEVNFLNMVENQTVVTLQDLADAIPRVAPVIVGLGGDVRDMAAMLAAMQEGGVSAAQGANALKSGLGSLINPTEKASKVLSEMGINLNGIVQANRGDLMGTVKAFGQALSGLDQFTRQQALEELFGKYQYARLGALFDNIVKDGTQASRVLQIAGLSAEQMAKSAEKELSVISEATSTKYLAAMERFKMSIAPVGEMFMKISTPIINFFSKLFEMFDKLPEGAKTFAAFATLIVGVVVPAGTMFLGLLMNLLGTLAKFGHVIGVAVKGFGKGGFSGAIQAVSQSLRYMGVEEITASTAAQQLGTSTAFANEALLNQVSAAGNATIAIDRLADAYSRLITTQASIASGRDLVFGAGSAAATSAAGGTPRVRPQRRNRGGKIKFMSGGGSTVPGFGNTDTVPAMLTPGEFVVNKQATQQNLPLLHAINGGMKMPGFNKGGKIPGVKYLNNGGPTLDELLAAYASASSELGGSTARQSTNLGLSLPSSTRTLDMLSPQELSMFNAMSKSALESRGINDALVRLFGLGIVPTSQEINNMLRLGKLSGADAASIFGDPSIWEPMTRTPAGALLPTSGPEFSRAIAAYVSNGLRSRGVVSDDDIYDLVEQAMKRSGGTNFYNELQRDPGALRFGLPELLARHLKATNPRGTVGSIYGPILSSFGTGVRQVDDYLGRPGVFGDFGSLGPLLIGPGKTRTVSGRAERSYENRPEFAFGTYMPGMVRTHAIRPIMANSGGLIPGVQYLIGGGRLNNLVSGVTSKYEPSINPIGYRALRLNPQGQRFKESIKKRLEKIYPSKPGSGQRARRLSELIPTNIREENVDEVLEAMRLAGIDPTSIDDNTLIQMISTQLSHTVKRRDGDNIIYQANELLTRPGLENKFIESAFSQQQIQEIANSQGEWTQNNKDRIKRLIEEQQHPVDQDDYKFLSEFISKMREDTRGISWINSGAPMAKTWFPIFEQLVKKRATSQRSNPTLEKSVTEAFNLNKGGLIPGIQYFANAGQVGKTFLGMPHSFNPKIATRYSALARSDEMLQTGRWADMPISDIGTQITSIGGFSSTLPGINGVYEIDGKRFVIKAHETPDSALLESRSSQLMRDLFGLESPEQEFIKFRHPQTGQLVSGVRSPYDERFASSASAIDPDSFVRQLIASAIRRDSDLQPDNLWNNVLADSGAAILGVSATGKPSAMTDRTITTSPRPVSEQVDINLLKSKGGAKKWFAEESANIARNMTEDEYVNGILQEISQVRGRLNSSLDSLIIGTPEEKATYRAILERDLAELEAYDWRSTYQHHVGLYPEAKKPPTAAAIAKKEKEAQERARQTGANTRMKYGIPWVNKGGLIPGLQYFSNAGKVLNYGTTSSMRAGLPLPMLGRRQKVLVDLDSTIFDNPGGNLWKLKPEDFIGIQKNIDRVHELRASGIDVEFVTARPPQLTELTQETLKRFGLDDIPVTYNDMKTPGKRDPNKMVGMPAPEYKLAVAKKRMKEGYDVSLLDDDENNRKLMAENGIYSFFNKGGLIPGIQYFANAGIVKRLMNSGLDRGQLQRKLVSDNQWDDLDDDLKRQVMEWDAAGNTGFGIFGAAYRARSQQQGDREAAKKAERQSGAYLPLKTLAMTDIDFGDVSGLLRLMRSGELDEVDQAFLIDYIKEGLNYGRLKDFHTQARQYHGQYYDTAMSSLVAEAQRIGNPKLIEALIRLTGVQAKNSGGLIQHLIGGGPAMSATTRRVAASISARKSAVQNLQKHGFNSLTDEEKAIIRASGRDVGTMPLFKGTSLLSPDIDDSIKRAILEGTEQSLIGTTTRVPFGSFSEKEGIAAPFVFDNNETRRVKEIYQDLFKSSYMIKDKKGKWVKPKTGKEALEARKLEMTTLPFHLDNSNYTDDDRIRINSEIKGYPPSLYSSETPRLEKLAEEYDQLIAGGAGKGIVYRLNPSTADLPPGQARITGITTQGPITTITLETGKVAATPVTKIGGAPIMPGGTDALRSEEEWFVSGMNKGGKIPLQYFSNGGDVAAIKAFATKPLFESANKTFVPGTGNRDTVPAALTPGEFVINKKATAENLPLLQAINSGSIVGYREGGHVQKIISGSGPNTTVEYFVRGGGNQLLPNGGPFDTEEEANKRLNAYRKEVRDRAKRLKSIRPAGGGGRMQGMGMKLGMGLGSLSGAMAMAPMIPAVGENQGLTNALGMGSMGLGIASMFTMLPAPIAAVAAGLTAMVAVAAKVKMSFDELARQSAKVGSNMGGAANRMQKISEVTGYQFARQRVGFTDFRFTKKEKENASQFADYFSSSDQGKKMIDDLQKLSPEQRYKEVSSIIAMAIADGMDTKTAKAYGDAIAYYTNDAMMKFRLTSDISSGKFKKGSDAMIDLVDTRVKELEKIKIPEPPKEISTPTSRALGTTGTVNLIGEGALATTGPIYALYKGINETIEGFQSGKNIFDIGASMDKGAMFRNMVPFLPIFTDLIPAGQEWAKTVEASSMAVGSSMQVLKELDNAEALLIEERKNGIIGTEEYSKKLAKLRSIQDSAAKSLETAFTLNQDIGLSQQAISDQLVLGGLSGDLAEAVSRQINAKAIGADLFGEGFSIDAATQEQKSVIGQVMAEVLTGITPENAEQKISEIKTLFANESEALLAAAADGLTSAELSSITLKSQIKNFVEDALTLPVPKGMSTRDIATYQTKRGSENISIQRNLSDLDTTGLFQDIGGISNLLNRLGGFEFKNFAREISMSANETTRLVGFMKELDKYKEIDVEIIMRTSDGMSPEETAKAIEKTLKDINKLKLKGISKEIKSALPSPQTFINLARNAGIAFDEISTRYQKVAEDTKYIQDKLDPKKTGKIKTNKITTEVIYEVFGKDVKNPENIIAALQAAFPKSMDPMLIPLMFSIQNPEVLALLSAGGPIAADLAKAMAAGQGSFTYTKSLPGVMGGVSKTVDIGTVGDTNVTGASRGGSGGGGGGTKSILQQLKDQFKQLQDIYNGMAKFINSKTGLFKGIAAGPFGPQFIEFLKSQGEEGIKILNGNLEKFKQVYNEFVKVQRQNLKNTMQAMPSAFRTQANLIAGQRQLQNKFAAQGISKTQSEAMLGMIDEGATSEYGRLTARQKAGKKISKEERSFMKDFERNLPAVATQARELDIQTLMTTKGELQSVLDYANNLDIPSEFAQKLTEAGIQMSTLGTSSANTYNEIKKIATLENQIQISDKFKEMNQDIKTSENIMRAIPGATNELIDSLKTLGVTSITSDDAIRKAAQGLVQYRLESERLKGRLTNLSEEFSLLSDAASAEVEKINKLEIAPIEKEIDKLNKSISNLEKSKRPEQTAIDKLREEEQAIQKVYDERIKALDEIQKANDRIAAQQKGQMDVASALSRGDIAGAAQAALELQRTMAQQRVEDTKSALQQQNESEREAIAAKIKTHEDNIKNIDQQILALQDSIAAKQDLIEKSKEKQAALEEKIYKYQLLRDAIETRRAAESSVDIGEIDIYKKIIEQQRLTLQGLGLENIAGGAEALNLLQQPLANEQYLRSVQPQGASAQLMTDVSKSIQDALPLIDKAVKEFIDPKTGLPKELNDVQETISTFAKIFGVSAESLQKFTSIAENYLNTVKINAEKDIRSAVADAINQIKAANQAAADNANTKPKNTSGPKTGYFGGVIYKAFGGMISYRGSRERAPGMMYGGKMKKFAAGSFVPGIGSTDKVPALLTPGEFVVRKPVAKQYGRMLQSLNSQIYPNMTNIPQPTYSVPNISQTSISPDIAVSTTNSNLYQVSPMQYNYNISVNAQSNSSPDDIANAVMYRLRAADSRRVRGGRVG